MAVKSCPTDGYDITVETEPVAGHKIGLSLTFDVDSEEWSWFPVAGLKFRLVRQNVLKLKS